MIDFVKSERDKHRVVIYISTFAISVLTFGMAFALKGCFPFGDRSAMVCDGIHQYIVFYEKLVQVIRQGKTVLTARGPLNLDFFGIFAYYLSSPIGLILLSLRRFLNINEVVTIMVLVKIGMSGCSFAWYARKRITSDNNHAVAAGISYALSDFVTGYYTNVMWLDALIILPILTYFLEELHGRKRWKGYFTFLLLSIFANYYTGYMLGMFSCCYYFSIMVKEGTWNNRRAYIPFLLPTAGCMVTAGIWLLPVTVNLLKTRAGNSLSVVGVQLLNGNPLKALERLCYPAKSFYTSGVQGNVNLYCGSLVLILLFLFIRNRQISRIEKCSTMLLIGFYYMGLWFSPVNMLLHGFHKPIGIPNRFSFILIFILLRCVFQELELLLRDKKKVIHKLLFFFILVDMCSHCVLGIMDYRLPNRALLMEKKQQIRELTTDISDDASSRIILVSQRIRNEEMLNNLNGMSLFSSTVSYDLLVKMHQLGVQVLPNIIQYKGNSELLDVIFGVKYLITDNRYSMAKSFYKTVKEQGQLKLLENNRALKAGNVIEKIVLTKEWRGKNPFEIHERILQYFGCSRLYDLNKVYPMQLHTKQWGSLFEIDVKKGEHGYLFLTGRRPEQIMVNGRVYKKKQIYTSFIDLGYCPENTIIRVLVSKEAEHIGIVGTYSEKHLDRIAKELKEVAENS